MALRIPVGPEDHTQGKANASVTLVEYGDYQCPFCGEAQPIVEQLQQRFGDNLRLVFRHFPITGSHPQAMAAATTAEFASAHGRFWKAHAALYADQAALGPARFDAIASELTLDAADLDAALQDGRFDSIIQHDFNGGVRSGVNGTPAFFVNGVRFDGPDFDALGDAIARAVAG